MGVALIAALKERYRLLGPFDQPFPTAVAALDLEVRLEVSAIVSMGIETIGETEFAALPVLKVIAVFGSGYDGIDLQAAQRHQVAIKNGHGANASSVADLALGLMIECVRQVPQMRSHLYAGRWNGSAGARPAAKPGLTGKRLGIYGLGAIGSRLALRGVAVEMTVAYHGRHELEACPYQYFASLLALAQWCDVLVLAARADQANRGIVGREVIQAVGPEGYLINVARGALVDEPALIEALQQGTIAGAGLDVFANEPALSAQFLTLPNVALTPHIGGVTSESRARAETMVLANLADFL